MLDTKQKKRIDKYALAGETAEKIIELTHFNETDVCSYLSHARKTGHLPNYGERTVKSAQMDIIYSLQIGDRIRIDRGVQNKKDIKEYILIDVPEHRRFIVCQLLRKGELSPIRETFDPLELSERIVR